MNNSSYTVYKQACLFLMCQETSEGQQYVFRIFMADACL